jgi:hypothetical protein
MKRYYHYLLLLIPASLISLVIYLLGFFWYRIDYDKGAYWPDVGYGKDKLMIWHNGDIIYNDNWAWVPKNRDSLFFIHHKMAEKYLKTQP